MTAAKDLTSPSLRVALKSIFDVFAKNAEKLCHVANSQQGESFNSIVTTKAPKTRHNGGSESYDFRVGASVCQKNLGSVYVPEVLSRIGLSSGRRCKQVMEDEDQDREERMEKRKGKKWQRRRLVLKERQSSKQLVNEVKEGTTYSTGVGFTSPEDENLETLPSAKEKAELLPMNTTADAAVVFFDVETTSLEFSTEMTQIAAVYGDKEFSGYVLPEQSISPSASKVTGLTKVCHLGKPRLCFRGKPVDATTSSGALEELITWLKTEVNASSIILCAHNAKRFDVRVVLFAAKLANATESLGQVVCGFVDSLDVLKENLPGRTSYTQENIYKDVVGKSYAAHEALADVKALREIVSLTCSPQEKVLRSAFTFESAVERFDHDLMSHGAKPQLEAKFG